VNKLWQIWKYAIGSFSDDKTEPYDNYVAGIRTIIFVSYMVTNAFIVSGVLRHWNDVPSELHETKEERLCKTNSNLSKN
jgi:ATP/ADP translocase